MCIIPPSPPRKMVDTLCRMFLLSGMMFPRRSRMTSTKLFAGTEVPCRQSFAKHSDAYLPALCRQKPNDKSCLDVTRTAVAANRTRYENNSMNAEKAAFASLCTRYYGQSPLDAQLMASCWHFADYQLNNWYICRGNRRVLQREGFQIGSPWHGDVMHASVLFLVQRLFRSGRRGKTA